VHPLLSASAHLAPNRIMRAIKMNVTYEVLDEYNRLQCRGRRRRPSRDGVTWEQFSKPLFSAD
jgi:hypothetical protein